MNMSKFKKLALASVLFAGVFLPATAFAEGEPGVGGFDGKAYFVWDCEGKVCYHQFDDLKSPDQGINYKQDTAFTDQSANGINYVFKQADAGWILSADFVDDTGKVLSKWDGKTAAQILASPDEGGAGLNPINFGGGNNSIAVNADWNFQVVIWREGYKAVVLGDNPDDYTYFPEAWSFNYNYNIDISSTTASAPAVATVYLKENTVKLKTDDDILSVTPLNVSLSAVTVVKTLTGFDLTFNSDYYDHITFEVKSSSGKVYYLKVVRTALLRVSDNFAPETTDAQAKVTAELSYPSGSGINGDTYKVIATVVGLDGKRTVYTLSSEDAIKRDYDHNTGDWIEVNLGKSYGCGKNLACSQYSVKTGKKMGLYGVYFSVIKNAPSIADVYPGTFSGSNKGALYNMSNPAHREVIYE